MFLTKIGVIKVEMKRTGCVGASPKGSGWATLFAWKGLNVILHDLSDEKLALTISGKEEF